MLAVFRLSPPCLVPKVDISVLAGLDVLQELKQLIAGSIHTRIESESSRQDRTSTARSTMWKSDDPEAPTMMGEPGEDPAEQARGILPAFKSGLLTQGVLVGVPQDPLAPHRGPLGSYPDRDSRHRKRARTRLGCNPPPWSL